MLNKTTNLWKWVLLFWKLSVFLNKRKINGHNIFYFVLSDQIKNIAFNCTFIFLYKYQRKIEEFHFILKKFKQKIFGKR